MRCACRHNDFGNNTVLFPARNPLHWAQPEEVQSILYYGDFDGDDSNHAGGGTAFAPVSRMTLFRTSMTVSWSGSAADCGALGCVASRPQHRCCGQGLGHTLDDRLKDGLRQGSFGANPGEKNAPEENRSEDSGADILGHC